MKISLSILTSLSLLSLGASAHIEPGVYLGVTADGKSCEMTAGTNYYIEDSAHPLNERIEIRYESAKFTVQHPPMVEEGTSTVYFNHDEFQGVLATSTGGRAIVIHMVHSESFKGPRSFTAIDHQWNAGLKTTVACLNLKKQ